MSFLSDTGAPAHPSVLEALARVNHDVAPSYGADAASRRVTARLAELFETDVEVLLVGCGTAANALALSLLCPPTHAVLCHEEAHIACDERGAVEFYTGGGALQLLPGADGRIDLAALDAVLAARDLDFVHHTPAAALSLTNLNECGAAYSSAQTIERAARARDHGLGVHLDGARLANAQVATGESLAALTHGAGADVVTFGLTKNGAMSCEAIVLFGPLRAKFPELQARAKRAGHLPPKMRFAAAQAEALLSDELWRDLAAHANACACALASGLAALPGVRLAHVGADGLPDGNEVFAVLPDAMIASLRAAGVGFYPWPGGPNSGGLVRLVTSWATTLDEVERALERARASVRADPANA